MVKRELKWKRCKKRLDLEKDVAFRKGGLCGGVEVAGAMTVDPLNDALIVDIDRERAAGVDDRVMATEMIQVEEKG